MKRRDGFTLLELLVVIGLIGVLMALLLPAIIKVKDQGQEKRIEVNAKAIEAAIDAYKMRYHKFPAKNTDLSAGEDVYYGNDTGEYYHNQADKDKDPPERIFECGGDNRFSIRKLAYPPDGNQVSHDDPFIDLNDFIVDGAGNVLKSVGGEQYRITLDLDGNYFPPGGVAIGDYGVAD